MNWTGGVLDRSRNANSSISAKQRAYFAKARGTLNNSRASPQAIEIFGQIYIRSGSNTGKRGQSCNDHVTPRRRAKGTLCKNERQSSTTIERSQSQWLTPRVESRLHLKDTNNVSPIVISSPQSSASSFKHTSQPPIGDRQASAPCAPTSDKARLLSMRDWVGVSHTKPAKVSFTDSLDRYQIGKRRRLYDINHQLHKRKRQRYESTSHGAWPYCSGLEDTLSQANISVRFGSAVDQESVTNEHKARSVPKFGCASAISDEMLLDDKYTESLTATYGNFKEPPYKKWTNHSQEPRSPERSPFFFSHEAQEPRILQPSHADEHVHETFGHMRAGSSESISRTSEPTCSVITAVSPKDSFLEPIPMHSTFFEPGMQYGHGRRTDQDQRTQNSYAKIDKAISWSKRHQDDVDVQTQTSDENGSKPSSLRDETDAVFDAPQIPDDEQMIRKHFIFNEPLERLTGSKALEDCTKVFTKAADQLVDVHTTDGSLEGPTKNVQKVTDEDEALWRNLIFGDEFFSQDFSSAKGPETAASISHNTSSTHDAPQTRLSVEAEDATGPTKGNAPSTREARTPSSTVKFSRASQVAAASGASQANSDEMLDGAVPGGTSAIHSLPDPHIDNQISTDLNANPPSSNSAHPSSSAPTTVDPKNGKSNITSSSSLIVEASTPKMPPQVQLSSDELSWSPARLPQFTAAKQAVVFKKPARYVGEQSLDAAGEPIRLGGRKAGKARRSSGRHINGGKEPKEALVVDWESREIVGVEQYGILEDEIEDELLGS